MVVKFNVKRYYIPQEEPSKFLAEVQCCGSNNKQLDISCVANLKAKIIRVLHINMISEGQDNRYNRYPLIYSNTMSNTAGRHTTGRGQCFNHDMIPHAVLGGGPTSMGWSMVWWP